MLSSFHLNSHTLGFHLHGKQAVRLEGSGPSSFHLNSLTHFRILSTDSKVRTTLYCMVNQQYHWKVLFSSFHLNSHTLGFHPQTQKLEPPGRPLHGKPAVRLESSAQELLSSFYDSRNCKQYLPVELENSLIGTQALIKTTHHIFTF